MISCVKKVAKHKKIFFSSLLFLLYTFPYQAYRKRQDTGCTVVHPVIVVVGRLLQSPSTRLIQQVTRQQACRSVVPNKNPPRREKGEEVPFTVLLFDSLG
jgi:hypothetical protein